MAQENDLTPIFLLGGLGVVAYFLYQNGTLAQWLPSVFGTAQTPAPSPSTSTGQTASTPQTAAPASSAPSYPLSVSLQNTGSSGGSATSFNVGDTFSVTVTGPPNQPVTATAQFGAQSQGPTSFGNTNAQGQLVITGTMPASDVGSWVEEWFVGGQSAGQLTFTVAAAGTSGLGENYFGRHSRVPASMVHARSGLRLYRGGR